MLQDETQDGHDVLDIGGLLVIVDTTDLSNIDYGGLIETIRSLLIN